MGSLTQIELNCILTQYRPLFDDGERCLTWFLRQSISRLARPPRSLSSPHPLSLPASFSAPSLCLFFCSSFSLSSYPASSSPPLSPLANLFFLFQILSSLFLFLLLSLCLCLGSLLNLTPRQPWPNKLQANTLCSHHVLLYYSFVCPPISLSLSRCSSGLNLSMLFCF